MAATYQTLKIKDAKKLIILLMKASANANALNNCADFLMAEYQLTTEERLKSLFRLREFDSHMGENPYLPGAEPQAEKLGVP